MLLAAGTRLGPYEILSAIGAGGMGEAYKARDTRLDRIVAIKVLPAHAASDLEFRQRFEREAKSISALDHPNICTLYDVGEAKGPGPQGEDIQFLVMQYLEGSCSCTCSWSWSWTWSVFLFDYCHCLPAVLRA